MNKLKAVNVSLCLFNNAIFIIRLGQILNFLNIERKINMGLAEINQRINANKDDFIISGLKRDNGYSVDRIKSYCLDTTAVFGICLISTAVSYFAAGKSIATVANTGLTGANILFVTLMGKYFPKQSNSYEFVETIDDVAVNAKKFYYHLNTQTLVSKKIEQDHISANDEDNIVYNHVVNSKNTATAVSLLNHNDNQSRFNVRVDNSCTSMLIDKHSCIKHNNSKYTVLSESERLRIVHGK